MGGPKRMVRLTIYVNPKKGWTDDEFQKYWSNNHGPLVLDWLKKYGITMYRQYHTPASLVDDALAKFPDLKDVPRLEDAGSAEFLMPDLACFERARQDPYYTEHVLPDELHFFNWDTARWRVGWEEMHIEDGEVRTPARIV